MQSRTWCAAIMAAACCFGGTARGADKAANQANAAAPMADNAVVAATSGRLPPNFTKVGVDPAQRAKIYSIQATYGPKIAALESQLATLKAQCETDIRNVLTADQQRRLDDINGAKKAGRMVTALKPVDPAAGGAAGAGLAGAAPAGKAPAAGARAAMQAPAMAPAARERSVAGCGTDTRCDGEMRRGDRDRVTSRRLAQGRWPYRRDGAS